MDRNENATSDDKSPPPPTINEDEQQEVEAAIDAVVVAANVSHQEDEQDNTTITSAAASLQRQYQPQHESCSTATPGAMSVSSGGSALSQWEQRVLHKQQQSAMGGGSAAASVSSAGTFSTASVPGAVAVGPGSNTASLADMEQNIMRKQHQHHQRQAGKGGAGAPLHSHSNSTRGSNSSASSKPGAFPAATNLSDLEQQVMHKQERYQQKGSGATGAPLYHHSNSTIASGSSGSSKPGAFPAAAAAANLSDLEQSIMHKESQQQLQQGGALHAHSNSTTGSSASGSSKPGAFSERTVSRLSNLEHSIREKQRQQQQQPGAATPGAHAAISTELSNFETAITGKQQQQGSATAPGAVPSVSTELSNFEHSITGKQQQQQPGATAPGAVSVSALAFTTGLSNFESSVMGKQQATPLNSSIPGVAAVSNLESSLLAKEQYFNASTGAIQLRQQAAFAANGREEHGTATTTAVSQLGFLEQDVVAKNQAKASFNNSTNPHPGTAAFVPAGGRDSGTFAASAALQHLSTLQNDIESKSGSGNSALRLPAASTPGAVGRSGNAALSALESEITAKSSWDAGTQQRQGPAASGLMADGGLHSLEDEIRRKSNVEPAALTFMSQPHTDQEVVYDNHAGPQSSLPQHFIPHQHNFDDPMLYRHPSDPRLNVDDSVAPSVGGDGFDSVPPPLTIPYSVSDDQAQSNLHHPSGDDYNSDDNAPSEDEPAAEVQAYVPPTVVEAAGVAVVLSTEEEERLMTQKRTKYVCIGAVCVCLIAAVIIVPTVLVATGSNERGMPFNDVPPSIAPSVAPSFAPSGAPTSSDFAEFLNGVLKPLNVSSESAFGNVDSPQYEAALWLVLEDKETYWAQNDLTADHWRIVQRYALATFHESTGGEKWKFCGKPPSVCFDVAWLTATDECEWYGVTCDSNGAVQMLSFRSDMDGNNLQGKLPPEISLLTQLRRFVAPANGLVGNIEVPFHGLSLLDTIVLSSNKLNGTMPAKVLEQNPNLGVLDVGSNRMSGTLPGAFSSNKLSHLQLQQNNFVGTIPEDIGGSTLLQIVDFSTNDLSGTVPESIYNLTSLASFSISNNTKLGGRLDARIGRLTALATLEAGDTVLEGSIPDELYQLARLADIVFSNASLSGTLSENLHQLNATLTTLRLSDNRFTGPIPQAVEALTALEELFLEGNSMTGTISDQVCSERGVGFQKLYYLYADCNIVCNCNDENC